MTSLRIRTFGLIAFAAAVLAGPLTEVAQATPVTSVTAPAIADTTTPGSTGTPGDTLTLTPGTYTGDLPLTQSEQWTDCSSAASSSCTNPIPGANGNTYTLQPTDVGKWVAVVETATNIDAATAQPTSATQTSNRIGQVAAPVPASPTNVNPPSITGATTLGQVLTETGDSWNGSPTSFTYQWLRCPPATACFPITISGNAKTYALVSADVGATIEVQMTASNTNPIPSAPATSGPTATITPPPPSIVAAPTISGTAQVGNTLTEGAAKWGTTWPPTSTAVQWYRCDSNNLNCVPIPAPAGTAKTYTLTDTDVGATMQVAETATNAGGSTTNYSGFSSAVLNANSVVPAPTVAAGSSPGISGSAQLGRTLSASGAQFNGNPGTFSYQWLRCSALGCSPIPGATDVTYTPTTADVGDSVVFSETASNSGGTSGSVQSSRTDTITAPSTTALQTNSAAPAAGQTVTLIATVTTAAGSVKPAGTVDFQTNGAAIPGCTGLALGNPAPTAVCQTSFRASVANVSAVYSAARGRSSPGPRARRPRSSSGGRRPASASRRPLTCPWATRPRTRPRCTRPRAAR